MTNRFAYNAQVFFQCIRNFHKTPLTAWLTVILSAIILSMPTGLYIAANQFQFFAVFVQESPELTVFLSNDVDPATAKILRQQIREMPEVETAQLVAADDALDDFEELTGLHAVKNYVQGNPLPTLIIIHLSNSFANSDGYQELVSRLHQHEFVDLVEFDRKWVAQLASLRQVAWVSVLTISTLFVLGTVLLICIFSRQQVRFQIDEIKLLSSIGANRRFIYRPFVYTAFLQSAFTVILAFAIVEGVRQYAKVPLAELAVLYSLDIQATEVSWHFWLIVALIVLFLNYVTTRFTVYAYVRKFEYGES